MNKSLEAITNMESLVKRKSVQVIDAPCGKGKTSWAIQHMKQNPDKKFLFITPFLTEVVRIQTECPALDFAGPSSEDGTKSNHFRKLLMDGRNIVTTHSLLTHTDEVTLALLKMHSYTLILDEVMDIMHQVPLSPHDLFTVKSRYLTITEDSGKAILTDEGKNYKGRFDDIINFTRDGRLYCFGGSFLIWQFPPQLFTVLDDMYLLTYLFRGQIQRCYFDFYAIPYGMNDISNTTGNHYSLTTYDPIKSDIDFRVGLRNNMCIYDGNLNSAVKSEPTYTWYEKSDKNSLQRLKKATYNYFFNKIKGKSEENMWTTFKNWEKHLKGKGYSEGFIPHNKRATNQYAAKKNMAYLIDRRLNPGLVRYLQTKGVEINENLYAISELVQWICRSAIRNGEPVNLFLPSDRMRNLLLNWLN